MESMIGYIWLSFQPELSGGILSGYVHSSEGMVTNIIRKFYVVVTPY
jgi:hypothetical protein